MAKSIFSILICATMFSSIVMANPWLKETDLPKSDRDLIQRLSDLTEGYDLYNTNSNDQDIDFVNYKEVIPRLLKSDLLKEDVLEKVLVAIKYSKFPVVHSEKYLLNILNHKIATDKTLKNILTFLKGYDRVVIDMHIIVEKIISKANKNDVLVDSVFVVLYSGPSRVNPENFLHLIINKLKGDYESLCFALHSLQDYEEVMLEKPSHINELSRSLSILNIDTTRKFIDVVKKEMNTLEVPKDLMACPNL